MRFSPSIIMGEQCIININNTGDAILASKIFKNRTTASPAENQRV